MDVLGKEIKAEILSRDIGTDSSINLNVSSLDNGVYFISISDQNKISTKKFMKQ